MIEEEENEETFAGVQWGRVNDLVGVLFFSRSPSSQMIMYAVAVSSSSFNKGSTMSWHVSSKENNSISWHWDGFVDLLRSVGDDEETWVIRIEVVVDVNWGLLLELKGSRGKFADAIDRTRWWQHF